MPRRPFSDLAVEAGLCAVGASACGPRQLILVFDLAGYSDHPALLAQEPQHATGVEQLLINGTPVIENGTLRRALPGRVIRNG